MFRDEAGLVAELLHWGFLPSWAHSKASQYINARVETAAKHSQLRATDAVNPLPSPARSP